jgi:hypothetical protein
MKDLKHFHDKPLLGWWKKEAGFIDDVSRTVAVSNFKK